MGRYNKRNLRLDPAMYQHPADKAASDAVKKSEAFHKALQFVSKNGLEKQMHGVYRASYAQITPEVSPEIHEMLREAQAMFDAPCMPDVFINRTYEMSMVLRGIEKPVLTISSEFLHAMDEAMLWGTLASELGGIKAGYGEIKMIEWLCSVAGSLLPPGIVAPLQLLLKNWHRYAQYSFDRTVLLATGDFNVTMHTVLLGEAPKAALERIDFTNPGNRYMEQSRKFLEDQDMLAKTVRTTTAVVTGEAFYASRYMELFRFYQSEYYDILDACEGGGT